MPKKRTFERYGREQETYDLVGRVHLDSLELYRKYTYEERHSYRLDAIGEHEIGEKKTVYEGSLDQLYNQDFRTFIEYNRQDVALLDKLDQKLKFIALSNELAHANTVLLQTTLGAVAVTEQAIINEAHRRGVQVPNRPKRDENSTTAAGAYVAYPRKGLHSWIGSMDINSLYPSVIRALNMAPECVMGQLRPTYTDDYIEEQMTLQKKSFAGAWENHFGSLEYDAVMEKRKDISINVDWEDGKSDVMSGAEIYKMIFESNNPMMISANGTIFTSEFEGVIPGLLARWYKERKDMQAMLKKAKEAKNDAEIEFWDKRQLVKKINLNSLYGAILNPGCRFFDKRIGQSTTLSGRQISKHMASKINEVITGEYNHVGKAMIYGDTDSAYFSAYEVLKKEIDEGKIPWTKESVVKLYDQVAGEVNNSFKKFMGQAFHCMRSRAEVIQAGRESVATSGLFITKKRYAILIYDLEGFRTDQEGKSGKIKAMGLDLKRSDTPVYIQSFLSELLLMVLNNNTEEQVLDKITQFRNEFKTRPGWEKGSPRRANNIGEYAKKEARQGKANMPGHVRASINWNTLKRMNSDKYSQEIMDGMKVIVCKLKKNPLDFTSVAYPVDELHIPQWFKELPFDDATMESTIIDNKLGNLLGVLGWDIKSTESKNTFNNLFDFGG
jgi:DNA polymerase elongation subunit (family B)